MSDLKKQAKRARKQIHDLDLSTLRDHLPTDFDVRDLNFVKKREDEAASRGFISGFLLGVVVGAVLALIFAPKRGDETREIVAHTATDLKDKATDLVQHVRNDNASDASDLEAAVDDTTANLEDATDETRAKISQNA